MSFSEAIVYWPTRKGDFEWSYGSRSSCDTFRVGTDDVSGYYVNPATFDYCECDFKVTVEVEGKPGGVTWLLAGYAC